MGKIFNLILAVVVIALFAVAGMAAKEGLLELVGH